MKKQFLEYAIPSALAMCVASLNTVLDGVFLGRGVGDLALAAVNIVIPLTIMFFGLATMVAVGGGAIVSKNFGANNDEKAVSVFRQVMKSLLVVTLILSMTCVLFAENIVKYMGATPRLLDMSAEYLRFYAMFCIPNLVGIALSSFVRNDSRPKLAMVATMMGTLVNITLNYIFIFKLSLGIKSAAIATGIGQTVTVLITLSHFIGKKGKLTFGRSKLEKDILKEIFSIGFPSFIAESAFSVIILIYNIVLTKIVGEVGISAYSIVNYITTNIYMIVLGVTFGAQPLISYNFGAGKSKNMIDVYNISIKFTLLISFVFCLICLIFGKYIIQIFTLDKQIIEIAYIALNLHNLAYFMIGINLTRTVYYQAIEIPKYSNLIGALRCIIVLPLAITILSKLFGLNGVWISMAVSELITIIVLNSLVDLKKCTKKVMAQC
ncbi:MAG: MATE family efflux transporter [Romboutsia sp.]